MTKDEKLKRIEDIEKELAELKESIKEEDENNQFCWIPEFGEKYYWIANYGEPLPDIWTSPSYNEDRLAIGNVFKTKEEAGFEVERLKVIHELRQYAEPRDAQWDGKNDHYYITCTTFNSYENRINVYSSPLYKHHDIYFSSFFRAWEAIEAVGKERVKKYYLGVKE